MSAAGQPIVQVLLDDVDNGGTFPYDITAYFRLVDGYDLTQRGTADEEASPAAVTLTLPLDNTDGRFTLGTTSGGYGAINNERQIRLLLTPNGGSTWPRFTGFVQNWPVEWPGGNSNFAVCKLTATDEMARWSRRELKSLIEEELLLQSPAAYYTLGDPEGATVAADSSGNNCNSLTGSVMPVFGDATGPAFDGLSAAQFSTPNGNGINAAGVPQGQWLECAFSCSSVAAGPPILVWSYTSAGVADLMLSITSGGHLQGSANGAAFAVVGSSVVTDGATHVAAVNLLGGNLYLWLDGVLVASTGGGGITVPSGTGYLQVGTTFDGVLAHVAVYSSPDVGQIQRHAHAMQDGFAGELPYERIVRLLDYLHGHTGTSNIHMDFLHTTPVPYVDITGKSVADAVQQVALGQGGSAYVHGDGLAVFHGRQNAATRTTPDLSVSTDSDILDPSTGVEGDTTGVVNYAEGKRTADGAVTLLVRDTASEGIRGRYKESDDYLVTTDAEVVDRLNWKIGTRSVPKPRLPSLAFSLLTADAAVQEAVMGLDVDSRVQVTSMLPQSPTGTTLDTVTRGYSEKLSLTSWTWEANVESWLDFEQVWILGHTTYGVLGVTTRLGV